VNEPLPNLVDVMTLIEAYSEDHFDLVEALAASQNQLMDAVIDRNGQFTPVELKVMIEQGISARLDILVSMIVAALADQGEWSKTQQDQERQAMKDAMRLVKNHVELMVIQGMEGMEEDADE
jgi:hypothetical protein